MLGKKIRSRCLTMLGKKENRSRSLTRLGKKENRFRSLTRLGKKENRFQPAKCLVAVQEVLCLKLILGSAHAEDLAFVWK